MMDLSEGTKDLPGVPADKPYILRGASTMAKFEYVDNVFLRSKNPAKMVEFYTKNLDLPVVYSHGGVDRLLVGPQADRAMIAIVDDAQVAGDRLSLISIRVDNIEEAFEKLENSGVRCDCHIRTFGPNNEFKHFNFTDPDGNIVTVVQPS
jgi:catechol 2,3-dioxygenase-like lactoylglutathione lyase family enzyme